MSLPKGLITPQQLDERGYLLEENQKLVMELTIIRLSDGTKMYAEPFEERGKRYITLPYEFYKKLCEPRDGE